MALLERRMHERPNYGRLQDVQQIRDANGHPFLQFSFDGNTQRSIPILSVRSPGDHSQIARMIATNEPVIFMAGGVIGAGKAVGRGPEGGGRDFWDKYKPGRKETSKVPMMVLHEDQYELIDWSKVHHDFRFLENARNRIKFFGQMPLHVVWPHNRDDYLTDPDTFVTRPSDMAGEHELVKTTVDTVCLYFQRDEDWVRIAQLLGTYSPFRRFGITSCNQSAEKPPFTRQGFIDEQLRKAGEGRDPWEAREAVAYIDDPIAEEIGVGSSQSQVIAPLVGSRPTFRMLRHGPVSPMAIKAQTGVDVEVPTNEKGVWVVKYSERSRSNDFSLDHLIELQTARINQVIAARRRRHWPFAS